MPWLTSATARALAMAAEGGDAGAVHQGGVQKQLALAVMGLETLAGLCGDDGGAGAMRAVRAVQSSERRCEHSTTIVTADGSDAVSLQSGGLAMTDCHVPNDPAEALRRLGGD